MTRFRLNPLNLEKWIRQNKATYTGCFVEGCLLDSFVMETERGYAFIYEHYISEWSSDYEVAFVAYRDAKSPEYDRLWAEWHEREDMRKMKAVEIIENGLFEAAVMLMDDEIRESLHNSGEFETEAEFLTGYCERHFEKYGSEFEI